jgi:hypothetical protein
MTTRHDKISDIVFAQTRVEFDDYKPEIKAIKTDGYHIVERIVLDYGRTIGLLVKKGKRLHKIMLRECFYDTDLKGRRTKWHGVIDIRMSPWSKGLRA